MGPSQVFGYCWGPGSNDVIPEPDEHGDSGAHEHDDDPDYNYDADAADDDDDTPTPQCFMIGHSAGTHL